MVCEGINLLITIISDEVTLIPDLQEEAARWAACCGHLNCLQVLTADDPSVMVSKH